MQEKYEDQLPEIPAEILEHIMTFLGPRDLANLELVCKDWQNLASSDVVWKSAVGQTKEEFSNPELYTILTLPRISGFSFGYVVKAYALVEEELQGFFQNTKYVKQISFPKGIGNEMIYPNPGVSEHKYKNRVFKSEEELNSVFAQARKESHEYTCYSQTEFFAHYKEINDEIHLYALKHITEHAEWTIFQKPFIFNRSLVNNFPSVKPASTNTEDKTAKPAQKTADSPLQSTPVSNATSNHVDQQEVEGKSQPLATAAAYQPLFFQPTPTPAPASTKVVNRAPVCLPSGSGSCTIS
ncbi:F-box protein [Fluoribacter gormanii]|uniref:F-box protein n=1 Tax=Fluoribacter gormanii TaxID=464 RepID=UPI002244922F|nr:F-box protein [Fluoribacter gormanii]MCW8471003.1 F-box protein [Fluoribacter gormanii]